MNTYLESAIARLYGHDDDFIIIGLTGRTGSGCSTAAKILCSEHNEIKHSLFHGDNPSSSEQRKQRIIKMHFDVSWQKFSLIQVRSIITLFIIEKPLSETKKFLHDFLTKQGIQKNKINTKIKSAIEIIKTNKSIKPNLSDFTKEEGEITYKFLFETLPSACENIRKEIPGNLFVSLYQEVGKNIRLSGDPFISETIPGKFFTLAEKINEIIKFGRKFNTKFGNRKTFFVIDAIRNPYEGLFFQDRYAAFFLAAISCPDSHRRNRLEKLGYAQEQINSIDKVEYNPPDVDEAESFFLQDIKTCLQKSEIYINNPDAHDNVSFFHTLANQIITFVSLIKRPGIITPSNIERCMQIAYTAKLNSGCISRQVGAVVADQNYSIKSVGWNDTPAGQVSCILRNRFDLEEGKDPEAYSEYERNDQAFIKFFKNRNEIIKKSLSQGTNPSYCFKGEYNKLKGEKNQVHTRSLHAEENAFLQLSKYGGIGIEGGVLFTTASPCELCSKKAYQLGIKKIYYIDPYPGIAISHILHSGKQQPELILFSGAIGKAFHKLYSPILPFKDELNALTRLD